MLKTTAKLLPFLLGILLVLVMTGCDRETVDDPHDKDPDNGPVLTEAPTFSVSVTFASIVVTIDDITDADETLLSFDEFYGLIDHAQSGLGFFSEDGTAPEIFHAFEDMEGLADIVFDTEQGVIEVQGDIELHTGAFAPGGSFADFAVFEHDRAKIRVVASDGDWEEEKTVAVPYLSITAEALTEGTRMTLSGNEAYGTGDLAFLPAFSLAGEYDIDLFETTGEDYEAAKANAQPIADLAQGHIRVFFEWVDDYGEGIDSLQEVALSFDGEHFLLTAEKDEGELTAAMTLYFMDETIGTIRYLQIRFLGEKDSATVAVSPITGSGTETTISSPYYEITHGDTLDFTDNAVGAGTLPLTDDMLVGELFERLEKESMYQTMKVTTEANRPLSPAVFGPAASKDPSTDTVADGDILNVLSADWTRIRYYRLEVLEVGPLLAAIHAAENEDDRFSALAEEDLQLPVEKAFTTHYHMAYLESDYAETGIPTYRELRAFVKAVNETAAAEMELLEDVNAADDAPSLLAALAALAELDGVETDHEEAYWQAYLEGGYDEKDFVAVAEVQAFVDAVNTHMAEIEALLAPVNDAADAQGLLTAMKDIDAIHSVEDLYKDVYYKAYLEEGYGDDSRFDSLEALQAFIDGVNAEMDAMAALLADVNAAKDEEALLSALEDEALALEHVESKNAADYWTAYEQAGYDNGEVFLTVAGLQAFIDAVNEDVQERIILLADVNAAHDADELLSALQDEELDLDDVIAANKEAYYEAYQHEGYDDDKTFRYVEEVQAFVQTVNEAVEGDDPSEADLDAVNDATNADELLNALQALDVDNVRPANKSYYWQIYQHEGYDNAKEFTSIHEVQGFVNGVNDYVDGN